MLNESALIIDTNCVFWEPFGSFYEVKKEMLANTAYWPKGGDASTVSMMFIARRTVVHSLYKAEMGGRHQKACPFFFNLSCCILQTAGAFCRR